MIQEKTNTNWLDNKNINYVALLEILDYADKINDPEFKHYNFMNKSQKEIKEKTIEIIKNL